MVRPRDRTIHHHDPPRIVIRKGPLWIGAGVFLLVPLTILNIQTYLYADPVAHADQLVESQHWRPPSRVLGETSTAKCLQWESTGELMWVQRDQVQIFVVDDVSLDHPPRWWFIPDPTNATNLNMVSGFIQWPPQQRLMERRSPDDDPFRITTLHGDDVSPWHAAQRIVQEQWGIPSKVLRIVDYEGVQEGQVAPLAQNHWIFLGKVDAGHGEKGFHQIYTYIWKVQQPPEVTTASIHNLAQAIQEQRFSGAATMTSLALALSRTIADHPTPHIRSIV
jgi:hypothetical protein